MLFCHFLSWYLICAPYRCKNKLLWDICFYSDIEHEAVSARFALFIAVRTIFLFFDQGNLCPENSTQWYARVFKIYFYQYSIKSVFCNGQYILLGSYYTYILVLLYVLFDFFWLILIYTYVLYNGIFLFPIRWKIEKNENFT